ncbi:DNA-binding transcriptional LysR family regulator [Duganella sp. 1224]|uniref:LysR family transcriptional regulator n=1 Tax=Duganella sp. 1224 TaxID=2587052 RepID=UPI0015C7BBD9|nr:LysR family transcriptional regulator [Duganella sp. 1224]NYE62776.1 DNA-binding transcriptional LysR family regulator [Duganella sp. 1224]
MDQLLALRIFVRIAEAGTFGKAADQLNMPRSTASKLLQDLEDHLGTRLIHRTTRTITVTPEGAQYYERARRLLGDLEDMDTATRQTRAQPKGRLRIDIGSIHANQLLLPALPRFQAAYPDIELRVGVSDRPTDLISEGIDCVIRGGALADTTLIARKLCEMEFVTCCHASYIEQHGRPSRPEDIEQHHRIVGYFSSLTGKVFPLRFTRGEQSVEIHGHAAVAVNESTAHLSALTTGMGIGQTFRWFVRDMIERGDMVALLEDWQPPRHPLYIMYPPNRHLNATVRVFVDWAVQLFAAVDDRALASAGSR